MREIGRVKALLDENLAARLAGSLQELGCDVSSFPNAWKGIQNGPLVERLLDESFACLITADKNRQCSGPSATG